MFFSDLWYRIIHSEAWPFLITAIGMILLENRIFNYGKKNQS
ncbi:hypothetical protein [Arsenicibacter rosenii]|nr:hypothetical protein [Arsenicibacter rosenii]